MPDFEELQDRLPISCQSFSELRSSGLVYVDKTAFVQEIAYDAKPLILIRPRRFGKSTLLSTVEELFLHGLEPYDGHDSYFKGLSIGKTWQDQGHYLVLTLISISLILCVTRSRSLSRISGGMWMISAGDSSSGSLKTSPI